MATGIVNPYAVVPGGGGGFNPETDLTWHSLFWAEGTRYSGFNSTNGGQIGTLPDETGTGAPDDATMSPTSADFTHSTGTAGVLNGQPHWLTTANQHGIMKTGTWTKAAPNATHWAMIFIYESLATDLTTYQFFFVSPTTGNNSVRAQPNSSTPPNSFVYRGGLGRTSFTLVVGDTEGARYDHIATGNEFRVGSYPASISTSVDPNYMDPGTSIRLNGYTGDYYPFQGAVAMVGLYDGDITADAKWSDLQAWALSHYGAVLP